MPHNNSFAHTDVISRTLDGGVRRFENRCSCCNRPFLPKATGWLHNQDQNSPNKPINSIPDDGMPQPRHSVTTGHAQSQCMHLSVRTTMKDTLQTLAACKNNINLSAQNDAACQLQLATLFWPWHTHIGVCSECSTQGSTCCNCTPA